MLDLVGLLRRRPHFRRLWLSNVVSLLGDWLSFVAVSLLALRGGDGVVALALVLVAHSLPSALLAPVAGTLADRVGRRRLLVGANAAEALITVAMAAAAAGGRVGVVQVLVFVRASIGAFREPAESAALPNLVDADDLLTANTVMSLTWSVMFALGMALGGVLAMLGPTPALALDAVSFVVAGLLLAGLPALEPAGRREDEGLLAALASVRADTVSAVRHAWQRPELLEAVLAKTPLAFAGGGAWVLLNLVAGDVAFVGSAALTLGLLQCVRGTGTGLGPLVTNALVRRGWAPERAGDLAAVLTFAGVALLAATRHWAVLLAAALAWGAGVGSNWVLSSAGLQRLAGDRFVGRLSAIDYLMFTTAQCVAALAGALVVERTGVAAASAWLGLGLAVPAALALRWIVAWRRLAPRLLAAPPPA